MHGIEDYSEQDFASHYPPEEDIASHTKAEGSVEDVEHDEAEVPVGRCVFAFVAKNLKQGGNRGTWKPMPKGWLKTERKETRMGEPPLSFSEFIKAHPQGCFVCYGRKPALQHDHRTCPLHSPTLTPTRGPMPPRRAPTPECMRPQPS